MILSRKAILVVALSLATTQLHAQGALTTQGFGYPPGMLSARASATGGGFAPFDAQTPINDAALTNWGRMGAYMLYAPEVRNFEFQGRSSSQTTQRFPVFGFGIPVGSRTIIGLSAATFLDRTWTTFNSDTQVIGSDSVRVETRYASNGALNDLRLGIAYGFSPAFRVGVAAHAITGENRLGLLVTFPDSADFSPLVQASTLNYKGSAFSGGLEWHPAAKLAVAASGRVGGKITAFRGDTVLAHAHVPARFDLGVSANVITGASVALHYGREQFSSMRSLAVNGSQIRDASELGIGAEVAGPRVGDGYLQLRVGGRWRELPYFAAGVPVKEVDFSTGFGLPFASRRAGLDVSLERAARRGPPSAKENAWTLGFGITIRP